MLFFKQSFLLRIFIYFLFLGALLTGAVYFLYRTGQKVVSLEIFAVTSGILLVLMLLIYFYEIVRPIRAILEQIKALLTGRKYRRIYTKRLDEIGIFAHFFNEVTKNLEKVAIQIKEGKRMLNELEVAGQIQKDILPAENPKIPGLDIVAKTRSAVELGGDNFDFITVKDNSYIYIGDVTGHGVPAALVMTIVHTLIHTFVEMYDNAFDIVVNTNRRLKTRLKATMFMTMLMLRWNGTSQKMTYVGSGHEHIMVYRAAAETCEVKPTGGIALGMVPDNSKLIKEIDLPLEKGDVIVLYSDGLTEGRNMNGEMFTMERLKKSVEKYATQYGSEGIVFHVAQDYSHFVQDHIQDDDVTLIAIRYVGMEAKIEAPKASL